VGKLHTIRGVRVELAKVYKDCRQGRLPAAEGAKLAFILLGLGRLIEGSDLERRVENLERQQQIHAALNMQTPADALAAAGWKDGHYEPGEEN